MTRALIAELSKMKRRYNWLPVLAIFAAQSLWALWALSRWVGDASRGWMYFLSGFPQINCVMTPLLIAMTASRVSEPEHKGQTFRLLHTMESPGALFTAKALCGYRYIFAVALAQAAFLLAIGALHSFGPAPLDKIGIFLLSNAAVGLLLYLFQLTVSLLFPNQMIALLLGLAGGFAGLFALFFPDGVQKWFPWSYYWVLGTVRYTWDPGTRIVSYYWNAYPWGFLTLVIAAAVLAYFIGMALYRRKEV